jgi:hypothetical protein
MTQSGLGRRLESLHCQFGWYLAWLAHGDCLALASVTHTGQGMSGGDHQGVPMRKPFGGRPMRVRC